MRIVLILLRLWTLWDRDRRLMVSDHMRSSISICLRSLSYVVVYRRGLALRMFSFKLGAGLLWLSQSTSYTVSVVNVLERVFSLTARVLTNGYRILSL